MTPVKAFLIFPKDKTALLTEKPQVGRIAHRAFENIRDWLARETGYTFDLRFDIWRSEKTARELGAYVPDSPYSNIPHNDPCGQGLEWGAALAELEAAAGGVGSPQVGRLLGLFINGGGWAGASQTWHPDVDHWLDAYSKTTPIGTDIGRAAFGDWQFQYAATGKTDTCAVSEYNEAFAKGDFTKGLGHECMHAFGMECHEPVTYYPDHLNAAQKAQYVEHNQAFLRPVLPPMPPPDEDPVEPVVPVPPVVPKYHLSGEFTGTVEGLPV